MKKKKISREATERNRQRNNQQIVHNRGVGVTSCFFSRSPSRRRCQLEPKNLFRKSLEDFNSRPMKIFSLKAADQLRNRNGGRSFFRRYFLGWIFKLLSLHLNQWSYLICQLHDPKLHHQMKRCVHACHGTFITHSTMTSRGESREIYWLFIKVI